MSKKPLPVWCEGMDEDGIEAETIILPVHINIEAVNESCTKYKDVIRDANGDKVSKAELVKAINWLAVHVKKYKK